MSENKKGNEMGSVFVNLSQHLVIQDIFTKNVHINQFNKSETNKTNILKCKRLKECV